jgi:hypothetical protein
MTNLQDSVLSNSAVTFFEARKLEGHGLAGSLLSFTCLFIASAMK